MNLQSLSDEALWKKTKDLVLEERKLTLMILHHLREVERRKLFAARGYPSLFEYCRLELGYSESAAQRRISSMRLLKEMPEIEERIEAGKLSLSVVSQAQTFFRQEARVEQPLSLEEKRELLQELEGKSSREAERVLAVRSSEEIQVQERVRAVSETHSEVRFGASQKLLGKLELLKARLAHAKPDASMAELLEYAVDLALEKTDPAREPQRARSLPTPALTRRPPAALKRAVYRRDGERCTYVDPVSGRKCTSQFLLEPDHHVPWAKGGSTNLRNLKLLCFQHNSFRAIQEFGLKKMAAYWGNKPGPRLPLLPSPG